MDPVSPPPAAATNPLYEVLIIKGIAAVTAIMDATRCVYNSTEAKKVALDAGLDFAADAGEIILMYLRLELKNPYADEPGIIIPGGFERFTKDFSRNKAITQTIAAVCYGIVYTTWILINALEQLNGWGEPDTGGVFTPDNGQSKFDSTIQPLLAYANPNQSQWSGPGAQSYTDANQTLTSLVKRTAAADTETAGTVQRQANQVQQLRNELAELKITLIGLLTLIMAFMGPLNFAAAKANAFPMDDSAEYFKKPFWSQKVEAITQISEPWLPFIVLPPCISATITAGVLFGLLYSDGNSNADELKTPTKEYQDVAEQANKIRASTPPTPSIAALTAPISHAPNFANTFRLPGTPTTTKASETRMSNTRSFADTFLTPHASATAMKPTRPTMQSPTTLEETTIAADVDDVATPTEYSHGIPADIKSGRTPAQPTVRQDRN